MRSKLSGRRQILKDSAALVGVAVGATRSVGGQTRQSGASGEQQALDSDLAPYGDRSHFVTSERINRCILPSPRSHFCLLTPLQNSVGIITPSSLHFVLSHDHHPPDIDPKTHHLLIHGMVDRPLTLTMDDLERLPSVSRIHFIECNANSATQPMRLAQTATVQETHGYTSCSEWTGVPLSVLLSQVGVQRSASWIIAEGAEQSMHFKSIPLLKVMDDVLVAYGQNGEPLRPQQGYPLRLVVPGWEGINNVKWLRRIKVVDQPYMGMMESTKYPSLRMADGKARWFQFEMGPKSVITRPSGGQRLPVRGFYQITGLAWSGGGAVRRVEVSTDGGATWKDAQIQGPVHQKAHTRFRLDWEWNGEEAVLQSRCTDERSEVQPTVAEIARIWRVNVDFFQKTPLITGHFNAIQPWRVTREGNVQNAIF